MASEARTSDKHLSAHVPFLFSFAQRLFPRSSFEVTAGECPSVAESKSKDVSLSGLLGASMLQYWGGRACRSACARCSKAYRGRRSCCTRAGVSTGEYTPRAVRSLQGYLRLSSNPRQRVGQTGRVRNARVASLGSGRRALTPIDKPEPSSSMTVVQCIRILLQGRPRSQHADSCEENGQGQPRSCRPHNLNFINQIYWLRQGIIQIQMAGRSLSFRRCNNFLSC